MDDKDLIARVERAIAENQHQGWLYEREAVERCDPERIRQARQWLHKAALAAIREVNLPSQPQKGEKP